MAAQYEIWLLAPDTGAPLDVLDRWDVLEYALTLGDLGAVTLTLPGSWNYKLARLDSRIVVWRKPRGGHRYLEAAFLVRYLERRYTEGRYSVVIQGPCYNDILKRRIIAYPAETAGANKTTVQADAMMKAYVNENLGALCTDTARDITGKGFSVQLDIGAGPLLSKAAAWLNLLTTLQEISEAANTAGTPTYFGVVPTGDGWTMEFRTKTRRWGNDHTFPDGEHGAVAFALERGNMVGPVLAVDYRDEETYVYAGGSGEGAARLIEQEQDATRLAASPLNRREGFAEANNCEAAGAGTALEGVAQSRLTEMQPVRTFAFQVQDTTRCKYGLHWGFGDLVPASFLDEQHGLHVVGIHVTVAGTQETVEATFQELT